MGTGGIAIGNGANASNSYSISMGGSSNAANYAALALGLNAKALATSSIALGRGTQTAAAANDAIAIGYGSTVSASNSIAIGYKVSVTTPNTIILGTSSDTVIIPGNVKLGGKDKKVWVYARANSAYGELYRYDGGSGDQTWYSKDCDRRLKNVGKTFAGGLEQIKKLTTYNFTYKSDETKTPRVGVMAQDLQKVFPNAVIKGEDGFLRIRMEDMFYAVINSIKELDAKISLIDQKQQKIDELERRIELLEKRIEKLESK
jgi:hypothetical protein